MRTPWRRPPTLLRGYATHPALLHMCSLARQVGASKLNSDLTLNWGGIEGFRIAGKQGIGLIAACQAVLMGGPEYARWVRVRPATGACGEGAAARHAGERSSGRRV